MAICMLKKNQHKIHAKPAFTVVEIIIVIVVIAILAVLSIIAYSGVQRQTSSAAMQSSLKSVAQKFKAEHITSSAYPTSLPAGIDPPRNSGFALATVSSSSEFCINATNTKYTDIEWHITQELILTQGLCSGDVIVASIIGDYNAVAVPPSAAVTVLGSGGGFKLQTDEAWTNFTFSWDAVPGASRFELQTKDSNDSVWYCRYKSTGYGSSSTCSGNGALSYNITGTDTSIVWSDAIMKPKTFDNGHDYRLRYFDASSNASEWYTLSLIPKPLNELTQLTSFVANPSTNWDSVTLAWNDITANNVPQPYIEIQSKDSIGSTWYCHVKTSGSGTTMSDPCSGNGAYSYTIPIASTSITWTDAAIKPKAADQPHEFRARLRSNLVTGMNSNWVTYSLSPPSSGDMDMLTNFTVTPIGTWGTLNLTWNIGNTSMLPNPTVEIQSKDALDASWYCSTISSGSGSTMVDPCSGNNAYSYYIPVATTSLNWTSTDIKPDAADNAHEFRARVRSNSMTGLYSSWKTFTLNAPTAAEMNKISNFTVTPAGDWSNVVLSWNVADASNLPSPTIEVQSKKSTGSSWYCSTISSGTGSSMVDPCGGNGAYSYYIPTTTTSLTWTSNDTKPLAGQTQNYRIRVRSNSITNVYSNWQAFDLTRP